jgi:hypothetical protein
VTAPLTAADARYFADIETHFNRLRGSARLLSADDYQVAARWWREGVPVSLVVATLQEVFEKHQARKPGDRINSLKYCARAVERAWLEVRELRGPARREAAAEPPVTETLAALAGALPERMRDVWGTKIRQLSGPAAEVEAALRSLEDALLAGAEAFMDAAELAELELEVDGILDGDLRARFAGNGAAGLAVLRARLRRQRLRKRSGLPVLTLFGGAT